MITDGIYNLRCVVGMCLVGLVDVVVLNGCLSCHSCYYDYACHHQVIYVYTSFTVID